MAKVQLDLENEVHLDVKSYQVELERKDKKRLSLKEVYAIVVKKGLEAIKKENPSD